MLTSEFLADLDFNIRESKKKKNPNKYEKQSLDKYMADIKGQLSKRTREIFTAL